MDSSRDSQQNSLEKALLQRFERFSLNSEIRQIAERLRDQAILEIKEGGGMCDEKQRLIESISVIPGPKPDEYLVVSEGDYGRNLEFGTKNSQELPWLTPAFVTVTGSIGNCLHGALKRALLKARRLPARR